MKFCRPFLLIFGLLLPQPAPAEDGDVYLGGSMLSHHLGNDALNNFNPGLTLGYRFEVDAWLNEGFVEGGVFHNSYNETAPVLTTGASRKLAQIGPDTELRAGIMVGIAYYGELSVSLKKEFGVPNVEGFIPIAGLAATIRHGAVEGRLTTVPPGTDVGGILNFSMAYRF